MGVFNPSSSSWSAGVPPPIPGTPSNLNPRLQPYLIPLEGIMDITGIDKKLQAQLGGKGGSTNGQSAQMPVRQKPTIDIGQNSIGAGQNSVGIGNPAAMTAVRAR